ncbi:MAG: (2Fe-2S)-binding protein [Actinomycetota bacterium]|nr:(2Fe-2S)-binding protein [Actinomycetota bacterium]
MAITDRAAREAIERGARTAGAILRACGSSRPCGGCTPALRNLLRHAGGAWEGDDVVDMERYREGR